MAYRANILINSDAVGAEAVYNAFVTELQAAALHDEVQVLMTSALSTSTAGDVAQGVDAVVYPDSVRYVNLTPGDVARITEEHLLKGRPVAELIQVAQAVAPLPPPAPKEIRVVLRNIGKINPFDIEDYIAEDGYMALAKVLTTMTPEQVLDEVKTSGLRGRGGAGFPAYLKWTFARNSPKHPKFIICNGDEGDPGAFMNRSVLEGDPHAVIEGMIIAAYVIGAEQGYFYVRAEYPIAIRTLRVALEQAREYGFLGENIFGSGFNFDLEIRMGAGASSAAKRPR
jgi:(2Fe-2S) ferredoxin